METHWHDNIVMKYNASTGSPMHVYLCSQIAADGGCESDVIYRINEGYRAWGALKSGLGNRGLGIKANSVYMKE